MTKIKNYILILFISIVCSSCIGTLIDFYQGYKYMASVNPKPRKIQEKREIYTHIYGIVENGKINRMGIKKNDVYKMNEIIYEKYGIRFLEDREIWAHDGEIEYYINFYNDFKIKIGEVEYILPKEQIKLVENNPYKGKKYYHFREFLIEDDQANNLILDIGEIEIIDRSGNIVKKEQKFHHYGLKEFTI